MYQTVHVRMLWKYLATVHAYHSLCYDVTCVLQSILSWNYCDMSVFCLKYISQICCDPSNFKRLVITQLLYLHIIQADNWILITGYLMLLPLPAVLLIQALVDSSSSITLGMIQFSFLPWISSFSSGYISVPDVVQLHSQTTLVLTLQHSVQNAHTLTQYIHIISISICIIQKWANYWTCCTHS